MHAFTKQVEAGLCKGQIASIPCSTASFDLSDTEILTPLLVSPFLKNGFILLECNYEKKTPTSSSCLVFCRICLFKEMTFRRCSWEVPNFSGLSSADSSDCCGKQTEEPKDLISPPQWANQPASSGRNTAGQMATTGVLCKTV